MCDTNLDDKGEVQWETYINPHMACGRMIELSSLVVISHLLDIVFAPYKHFATCSGAQIDKLVHKERSYLCRCFSFLTTVSCL